MKHTISCTSFKKYFKNSLVGFADITIGELRLTIKNVTLHRRGDARWVSPPGCAWVKDGRLVTDGHGKIQYSQIIEFADCETRDAFSAAVWRAVEAVNPKAGMPLPAPSTISASPGARPASLSWITTP